MFQFICFITQHILLLLVRVCVYVCAESWVHYRMHGSRKQQHVLLSTGSGLQLQSQLCLLFIASCINKNITHKHKHTQIITWANWMLVATHSVSMVTASSGRASSMGRAGPGALLPWLPTNSIGHLVPAEVEVGGVGLDHRCGAVKRTNFLIVTNIWKRKQFQLSK